MMLNALIAAEDFPKIKKKKNGQKVKLVLNGHTKIVASLLVEIPFYVLYA